MPDLDAEEKLRQDVRDAMSTYSDDSEREAMLRFARKAVIGVFACFAAFALFQEMGGDKVPQPGVAANRNQGRTAYTQVASREPASSQWDDVSDGTRELVVRSRTGGHYIVDASVNGASMPFIVDTGASTVFLSADAAREAGIDPDTLDYTQRYRTANGVITAAPVILREVRIGQLSIRDVEASVSRLDKQVSLLGMSFLNRLESYEVRDGRLFLRW